MKKLVIIAALVSTTAYAQRAAEVLRVEPRYGTSTQQQCRDVAVQRPATTENPIGGVLGAISGAAIGNQLGGGAGKDIATVVGGVMGYQLGRGESSPGGVEYRTVCENIQTTVQRGETVTFRYNNRVFTQTFE